MTSTKSPISTLQEITSSKLGKYPVYHFEQTGEQEFKCFVKVGDFIVEAKARGKQTAKTLAADAMLEKLGLTNSSISSNNHPLQSPMISSNSTEPCLINSNPRFSASRTDDKAGASKILTEAPSPKSILEELKLQRCLASLSGTEPQNPCNRASDVSNKRLSDTPIFGQTKASRFELQKSDSLSANHSSSSSYATPDELESLNSSFSQSALKNKMEVSKSSNDSLADFSDALIYLVDNASSSMTGYENNPVGFLEEKMKLSMEVPSYELINVVDYATSSQTFYYEVTAKGVSCIGSGPSKREAKANAAISLLRQLGYESIDSSTRIDVTENIVGKLQTYCQTKYVNKIPMYTVVGEKGEAHKKTFTMQCTIGAYCVEQSASTKQMSKHLCAKKMLEILEKAEQKNQINEIKIESKILDESINELAWQRLSETRVRDKAIVSIDKIPLRDYPYLFENNTYGNSDTLLLLKLSEKAEIYTLPDPKEVFKSILSELSIDYELATTPSKHGIVLNLLIKCHPNWSFMETASSLKEAQTSVFISALEFLYDM